MLPSAMQDIDQMVLDLISQRSARTVDEFFAAAQRDQLLDGLQHATPAEYLRGLRRGPEGDLVAAALLRVLAGRRDAIDESSLKTQIASFLDTQYAQMFTAYYERPRKAQTFDVLNAFVPVIPTLEGKAAEIINSLRAQRKLDDGRERLFKLLNGLSGRVVFGAFLPLRTVTEKLAALIDRAIEVCEASDVDSIGQPLRIAEAHADELESIIGESPTHYGRFIVINAVDSIREAMRRKVELQSPPAYLAFAVGDRPLPLLEPGITCLATVTVTNEGEAAATDVQFSVSVDGDKIKVAQDRHMVGRIGAHSRSDVIVPFMVMEATATADVQFHARWVNLDHSVGQSAGKGTLYAHEVHIDWDALVGAEPYALYPVELREQLVGRNRELSSLLTAFQARPLANLYVTGQRRVGKTSLIRVLESELRDTKSLYIAAVEAGEVRGPSGSGTIATLGLKLATRIVNTCDLQQEIEIPDFTDSLAPLAEVVDRILEWDPDVNFLFVIDEFDELPHDTYRRDGPGDALFVPMRSLAQKPNVGWLLVGGEQMPFIRDEQAARLNTFRELSVSYLALSEDDRTELSPDFGDLVRQPLPGDFRVEDSAVRRLFIESEGNPHFAKEICATLFARAVSRRDAVVTEAEVDEAAAAAARERDVELFVHFWEDGIFGAEEERRRIEIARRQFLTGLAYLLRGNANITADRLRQAARDQGVEVPEPDRLRNEFVRRSILTQQGDILSVRVPLFRRWLEGEGIYKLPPKGLSERRARELSEEDQALRVSPSEVRRLADRWKEFEYKGRRISREDIDAWIGQFELLPERRMAFRFLERLLVLGDKEVYRGLRNLQRLVASDTAVKLARGQRALSHIYVAALGGDGASGQAYAYQYRQANNISGSNVVAVGGVIDRLLARRSINVVVLVDDFIGSGRTSIKGIKPIAKRVHELRARSEVAWFLFAVSGTPDGVAAVEASKAARDLGLRVELAHPVLEADLPLSSGSTVFDEGEREAFRALLAKYGKETSAPQMSLGFGECAAPVVFPDNCPNNAPAILWSEGDTWRPLFTRTAK